MNGEKRKWEQPICDFCGNKSFNIVWKDIGTWITEGSFQLVRCKRCGLVYLSPRPQKRYISNYYPPESYWGQGVFSLKRKENFDERDKNFDFIFNTISKKKKTGRILDIGAGSGVFLSKFKSLHWKTYGVELSKEACLYAKKMYGLELLSGSFPEVSLASKNYDVITLNSCLEHLYKPRESLVKIYNLLNKQGFVIITVPNFNSLGKHIFGKSWYALQPPTHLYQYSSDTLKQILNKIGFRNIRIMHNFQIQNRYILFESLRLKFSSKYRGKNLQCFAENSKSSMKKKLSVTNEIAKIFAEIVSFILSNIEPVIKRGEVITIYAEKN